MFILTFTNDDDMITRWALTHRDALTTGRYTFTKRNKLEVLNKKKPVPTRINPYHHLCKHRSMQCYTAENRATEVPRTSIF